MDLLYIRILRFFMKIIGSWPGRELGEDVWKISDYYIHFLHIQAIIMIIGESRYIILNIKNMPIVLMGNNFITVILATGSTCKIPLLSLRKKYYQMGKLFFTKMHLVYYKNTSDYAMKIHLQVHRLSEICTAYLITMMAASTIFYNVGPMYVNYSEGLYSEGISDNSSKVYALAVYYNGFPFLCDYLRDYKCYLVVNLYTWYMSCYIGVFLIVLDLYVYIIVFHIWGHYKILNNNLKTFPRPLSLGKYTVEESERVNETLKDCIRYHLQISKFTGQMSDVFGATLFIYTGALLLISCLLLLECSYMTAEALIQYAPITVMVFQILIQFGLVFELIGTAGDDLRKQVYDLPWECMDIKNRYIVLFFLMNVQKPVRVKALGVVDMGFATVASILKTSFSYFTFLRSVD